MFASLMPNRLYTTYEDLSAQGTGRGLSPALWKYVGGSQISQDGLANGFLFADDFLSFYPVTLTSAAGQLQPGNGYFAYIEADATVGSIKPLATEVGGAVRLLTSTDAADGANHQTSLGTGGNLGAMCKMLSASAGSGLTPVQESKKLIFEARWRTTSITDGIGSSFIGLGEEGLGAAATPLADDTGHKLASKDLIGWVVTEDDNDLLEFKYRKAGAAIVDKFSYGTPLVANQWIKTGFIYDPMANADKRIKLFVNNVEQSTYITSAASEASTFPDGEELAMYAAVMASAHAAPHSIDLDWWAVWQQG
jgi:hypothetical protein